MAIIYSDFSKITSGSLGTSANPYSFYEMLANVNNSDTVYAKGTVVISADVSATETFTLSAWDWENEGPWRIVTSGTQAAAKDVGPFGRSELNDGIIFGGDIFLYGNANHCYFGTMADEHELSGATGDPSIFTRCFFDSFAGGDTPQDIFVDGEVVWQDCCHRQLEVSTLNVNAGASFSAYNIFTDDDPSPWYGGTGSAVVSGTQDINFLNVNYDRPTWNDNDLSWYHHGFPQGSPRWATIYADFNQQSVGYGISGNPFNFSRLMERVADESIVYAKGNVTLTSGTSAYQTSANQNASFKLKGWNANHIGPWKIDGGTSFNFGPHGYSEFSDGIIFSKTTYLGGNLTDMYIDGDLNYEITGPGAKLLTFERCAIRCGDEVHFENVYIKDSQYDKRSSSIWTATAGASTPTPLSADNVVTNAATSAGWVDSNASYVTYTEISATYGASFGTAPTLTSDLSAFARGYSSNAPIWTSAIGFENVYFINALGSNTAPFDTPSKGATTFSALSDSIGTFGHDVIEVVQSGGNIFEPDNSTIYFYSYPGTRLTIRSYGVSGGNLDRFLNKPKVIMRRTFNFETPTTIGYEVVKYTMQNVVFEKNEYSASFDKNEMIYTGPNGGTLDSVFEGLHFRCVTSAVDSERCEAIHPTGSEGLGDNVQIKNCIFESLQTFCVEGGVSGLAVINCTFYDIIEDETSPQILNGVNYAFNNLFYNCESTAIGGTVDADYNLFYNVDDYGTSGVHDVFANPYLISANEGDFKIYVSASPALEAGTSAGVSGLNSSWFATTDFRGQSRPVDIPGITAVSDGTDIGAYEALNTELTASIPVPVVPTSAYYFDLDKSTHYYYNPYSSFAIWDYGPSDTAATSGDYVFDNSNNSEAGLRVMKINTFDYSPYVSASYVTSAERVCADADSYTLCQPHDGYIWMWRNLTSVVTSAEHAAECYSFDGSSLTLTSSFSASDIYSFSANISIESIKFDHSTNVFYFAVRKIVSPFNTIMKAYSATGSSLVDVSTNTEEAFIHSNNPIKAVKNNIAWCISGSQDHDVFYKLNPATSTITIDSVSPEIDTFGYTVYTSDKSDPYFWMNTSGFAYNTSTSAMELKINGRKDNPTIVGFVTSGFIQEKNNRLLTFSAVSTSATLTNTKYISDAVNSNIAYRILTNQSDRVFVKGYSYEVAGNTEMWRYDVSSLDGSTNNPYTLTEAIGRVAYKRVDSGNDIFVLRCHGGWDGSFRTNLDGLDNVRFVQSGINTPYLLNIGDNDLGGDTLSGAAVINGAVLTAGDISVTSYTFLENCYLFANTILWTSTNYSRLDECTFQLTSAYWGDALCDNYLRLEFNNCVFVVPNSNAPNIDDNAADFRYYISAYNTVFSASTSANVFSANIDLSTSAFLFSGSDLSDATYGIPVPEISFTYGDPVEADYIYPIVLQVFSAENPTTTSGLWQNTRTGIGAYSFALSGEGHIGAFYFGPPVSGDTFSLTAAIDLSAVVLAPTISAVSGKVVNIPPVLMTLTVLPPLVFGFKLIELDFIGIPRLGSSPLSVDFTALIRGTEYDDIKYKITEYRWYFDYGRYPDVYETSTVPTINHIYTGYAGQTFDCRLCVIVEDA